jgi:hypothetical protein
MSKNGDCEEWEGGRLTGFTCASLDAVPGVDHLDMSNQVKVLVAGGHTGNREG